MTPQEAIALIDNLLQSANKKQKLTDIQSIVFLGTWEGYSYQEIADRLVYEPDSIKHIGSHLWQNLSQIIGEKVSKHNLRSVLRRYEHRNTPNNCIQDWGEAIDVSY
ncbi:MAG: NB-ARC domain-containing protein, partial [Microcoleus sp.]